MLHTHPWPENKPRRSPLLSTANYTSNAVYQHGKSCPKSYSVPLLLYDHCDFYLLSTAIVCDFLPLEEDPRTPESRGSPIIAQMIPLFITVASVFRNIC